MIREPQIDASDQSFGRRYRLALLIEDRYEISASRASQQMVQCAAIEARSRPVHPYHFVDIAAGHVGEYFATQPGIVTLRGRVPIAIRNFPQQGGELDGSDGLA